MNYTPKIEQAIRAAALLHEGQYRKGRASYPYVSHLYSVATIISQYTDDESTIVGGLLHDTIEDTEYTYSELKEDFGEAVHDIVYAVTEEKEKNGKELSWKDRKDTYIQKLKKAPEGALIVAAADKIHNLTSIVEEYGERPDVFVKSFGGTLDEKIYIYQSVSNILNRRLENKIVHDFNDAFESYKKFIETIA